MRRLGIRRCLLTGLLALLPLWLVWLAGSFLVGVMAAVSEPALRPLFRFLEDRWGVDLEWLLVPVGVVLTLVLLCLVGWAGLRLAGTRLRHRLAGLLDRFPLLRSLYHGTRRLFRLLHASPERAGHVVLIVPEPGAARMVGLMTQVLVDTITGEEYAAVYVPTTPNPAGGQLHLVPIRLVQRTDLTLEEALELVVSGGAGGPARLD